MPILIALLVLTTIILICPIPQFKWVKSIMCAITTAFIIALGIHWLSPFWINAINSSPITLTAIDSANKLAEGTEIWIKGVIVDGRWYPATTILTNNSNWIQKDKMVGWRSYDQPAGMKTDTIGRIPAGQIRTLIFEANPWRGLVAIKQNGAPTILADTYDEQQDQEMSISLNAYAPSFVNKLNWGLVIATFLVAFLGVLFLFKYAGSFEEISIRDDHVWGMDILRILCIFTVVLLHCTCNTFNWDFGTNNQNWYNYLYINVATSFAVPCFFMLSGALLIRENLSIKNIVTKRILNVCIPLLFWSGIYTVVNIYYGAQPISFWKSMLSSIFTPQYAHLWFMYPLIGLYLLLPFISQAYYHWDLKIKLYAGVLLFAIPGVIFTTIQLAGKSLPMPWFALGFPELGIFVLGRLLWDTISKRKIPVWASLMAVFFSFSAVCVSTYALSISQNNPIKLFGSYGNLFVMVFAAAIFVFILSLETFWRNRLPSRVKRCIAAIAQLSMGVYFVHMTFLIIIGNSRFFGAAFTNNAGSLHNMVFGSVVYFVCSAMFVYVISKIPVIRKIVI